MSQALVPGQDCCATSQSRFSGHHPGAANSVHSNLAVSGEENKSIIGREGAAV